mmetsp:Transcript_40956/g.65844  ORF Transcript_40956/g.65844 Transcript_40956/m.65844 type:complete len:270 (-) Transcript_40956:108-917(-)
MPAAEFELLESFDFEYNKSLGQVDRDHMMVPMYSDGTEATEPVYGQVVEGLTFNHFAKEPTYCDEYTYDFEFQQYMYDISQTLTSDEPSPPFPHSQQQSITYQRRSSAESIESSASFKRTSIEVFLRFVTTKADPENNSQQIIDASKVISKEGFQHWLETRRSSLKHPEESFRRSLTAHITGLDGRKPFSAEVEAALLKELRQQRVWPCFQGASKAGKAVKIGLQGFRTLGYHENLNATGSVATKTKKKKNPHAIQEGNKRRKHDSNQQ